MIKCELCDKEALYHSAKWISDESMVVYYWCEDHKPDDGVTLNYEYDGYID